LKLAGPLGYRRIWSKQMLQNLERLKPLALLLLRISLGAILIFYGRDKLFTQTANYIQSFPRFGLPSYFTYIAGVVELFGGCLLIVGLFTRVAALLIVAETVFVIAWFHRMGNLSAVQNYQVELLLAVTAFALVALGAGAISLDQPIFGRKTRAKVKA